MPRDWRHQSLSGASIEPVPFFDQAKSWKETLAAHGLTPSIVGLRAEARPRLASLAESVLWEPPSTRISV